MDLPISCRWGCSGKQTLRSAVKCVVFARINCRRVCYRPLHKSSKAVRGGVWAAAVGGLVVSSRNHLPIASHFECYLLLFFNTLLNECWSVQKKRVMCIFTERWDSRWQ